MTVETALVTGAAGFLGSTLVDRLLAEGRRVVGVDDLSAGRLGNLDEARRLGAGRFEFHRADVVRGGLDAVVERHRPQVVVHLAGPTSAAPSVDDPVADAMVTVLGTVQVLEAARRHGVGKVVHALSGAVYGDPDPADLPLDEDHPGPATTPHGAAQRSAETYLHTYEALYGLRWTSLVLTDVYGPRQSPLPGTVAAVTAAMVEGRPVTVTGDGERTRDLLYVDDAVHALVLAMDHADGLRCNVGTGQRTDMGRLVEALAAATGHTRDPIVAPEPPGVPRHLALSPRRAADVLGWKPWTTLEEGLAATLRHARLAVPAQ